MKIIETERLHIRYMKTEDAQFMLELLNEPDWIKYIGDRGIRTVEEARKYIVDGPMAMYEEEGFGLYLVELKESKIPIGICGLIQRDFLKDVDLGFAILSEFWGKGYAYEAARATLTFGHEVLGFNRIAGFTSLDNEKSINLLLKLGMAEEGNIKFGSTSEDVRLFAIKYK
ncbi:GNAT family N-acetyltransferase [Paenisporosarcina sp. OV554]|uniref:GNAT family N-acetyltransferase n=1 Tax=Paenisporosarcina sp. OV554 TaxID=2135694 RepID=UPI000D3C6E81|nr:GNAT family N-acetyltransferase [Paenisporosarcina sp. OV554]PUB16711.1 RimJ/RimL family protein N-acetyltransferase [Paenisporosarcina sp. OV554]